MVDNPFHPLSLIAGPAILMNACAIMQNGATTRYSLAIGLLREFRVTQGGHGADLSEYYTDPPAALRLIERRVRLLLFCLNLLYAAVGLFGLTAFSALAGSFLAQGSHGFVDLFTLTIIGAGGLGLILLFVATLSSTLESECGKNLLKLHRRGI